MSEKQEGSRSALTVGEVVAGTAWDGAPVLARLLHTEGVELTTATEEELDRGTPVYVNANAPAVAVQRLMARFHIRSILVLDATRVVGAADLLELAEVEFEAPSEIAVNEARPAGIAVGRAAPSTSPPGIRPVPRSAF